MVTVKLPRASWDEVDMFLGILKEQGYLIGPLRKEINDQVDSQEY